MADNESDFSRRPRTRRSARRAPRRWRCPRRRSTASINMPVMHQAVKAFIANQRQGNASTKIRKYVVGGNQKPWKQKGTGRARQGSTRAPHFVGGGTVFGPTPRAYDAVRAAPGPRARQEERAQRAGARRRDLRDRRVQLRRAEDAATARADRAPRRRRTRRCCPHRRREAERLPQRPQHPERARDAVRRRLDLPHPLVGCRARRGGCARPDARADGERAAGAGRRSSARPAADVAKGERKVAKRAREDRGEDGQGAAKKTRGQEGARRRSRGQEVGREEVHARRRRSNRCRRFIARSCGRSSRKRARSRIRTAGSTTSRCIPTPTSWRFARPSRRCSASR